MMNKLIGERDWPAMAVSHLLLDLPLTECSHVIQPVDCRDPRKQVEAAIISPDDRKIRDVKNLHQKYCQRDIELWRELTYFDFMTKVSHTRKPWSHFSNLAKQRVLSYFPRYKLIPTDPDFEDFAL